MPTAHRGLGKTQRAVVAYLRQHAEARPAQIAADEGITPYAARLAAYRLFRRGMLARRWLERGGFAYWITREDLL